jgi:hypothetical protein
VSAPRRIQRKRTNDSCDAVLDTDTNDFDQAREVMKREDWKVRKIAKEWLHGCPKCGVPT